MAVIPTANNSLNVSLWLTDKLTGEPLANKEVTITFRTLEQLLGGTRTITNTKTLTTNSAGIITANIKYGNDFDSSFGVQASFKGDDDYNASTVKLVKE